MANANETKAESKTKSEAEKPSENTDIELIKAQLERLRDDLSSLGEMVGLTARQRLSTAREQVATQAEQAREQAVDHFTATLNEAEASVRRNPLTALAIVLGIGYLFGVFSRK